MKKILLIPAFVLLSHILCAAQVTDGQPSGTLVVNIHGYDSEIKLKKSVQRQLAHSGVEWGIVGSELLITLVNRSYVAAELPYLTRYGESRSLELPVGEYTISCIGLVVDSVSRDIEAFLARSAFVNKDVLRFSIRAGQSTRLDVHSLIRKQKAGLLVRMFVPQVRVVVQENAESAQGAIISDRTSSSVPWGSYSGPLRK
jgi:hypothetical protein